MAIGWFICGYKLDTRLPRPIRYCAMNDFTAIIRADGGAWAETEVLGGYALVKVRASATTLTTIAGTTGFQRLPAWMLNLDTLMGDLTTAQRNAIVTKVEAMGYTPAEIAMALGVNLAGWKTHTIGDLFRFVASKRLKPRWDDVNQQIVLDGALQACLPVAEVDAAVTDTGALQVTKQVGYTLAEIEAMVTKPTDPVRYKGIVMTLADAMKAEGVEEIPEE